MIKSIFLSKVLASKTNVALLFKEGAFRILNVCLIVHLSLGMKSTVALKPLIDPEKLADPSV